MSTLSDSVKEFINVAGLAAKIKALETELSLLKTLQSSLGVTTTGRKPGRPAGTAGKASKAAPVKRGRRGKVKGTVLAFLEKAKPDRSRRHRVLRSAASTRFSSR
jgi:hypothetical protein